MSNEYTKEAKILKSYLDKLKNYYSSRLHQNNFTPGYANLDFRVKKLYDMYLEISSIGKYLSRFAEVNIEKRKADLV